MESLLGLFDPSDDGCGRSKSSMTEGMKFKDDGQLPPEPQLGNIEYKLKLLNPSKTRFQHLVTQMKWRLREGGGEAIYEIGVEDSGLLAGLPDHEMEASLRTLDMMANELGATTAVLRERDVGGGRTVTEVLVRKVPADQHTIEVRVAVLGSADAGKSTLVGVLTQGELDNGRGRARLNMFRHLHEVQSGRTSSISHEVLAFDSQGQVINCSELMTGEDVQCAKLVSLLDLAGHRKYLRTTVQALSGYRPQYAMLVVSSQAGVVSMTQEHFSLLHALEVPVFIVITKTDLGPLFAGVEAVRSLLTTARRVPLIVNTEDDVLTAGSSQNSSIVPVFCVSSVTGRGLDLLTSFLHVLPPGVSHKEKQRLDQEACEFQIDEVFRVVDVGTVVGGLLTKGVITEGMNLFIGPDSEGDWSEVKVESMHRNKAPCRVVHSTQSASLALQPVGDKPVPQLRSGMLLVAPAERPTACIFFQATVSVLYHSTSIQPGFQMTVHVGNVRQTAVVEGIMCLRSMATNDRASVLFRFVRHPECIRVGARLLFREGQTKGIGKVTQVFPYKSSAAA